MDKIGKILAAGITGTSVMTVASELMAIATKENFKEPEHLATMIGRLAPLLAKRAQLAAGWGAHYAVGCAFAAAYVELWERRKLKPNIKNGIGLGLVSGVLGALIWKATFKAHPLPPAISYRKFYLQLIPAHVVFALFATISYHWVKQREVPADRFS